MHYGGELCISLGKPVKNAKPCGELGDHWMSTNDDQTECRMHTTVKTQTMQDFRAQHAGHRLRTTQINEKPYKIFRIKCMPCQQSIVTNGAGEA